MVTSERPKNIDEFIAAYPKDVLVSMQRLRETIAKAARYAEECINYGMPTFKLKGNLVHFSAYKKHIGFYPGPSAIKQYKNELSGYKTSKGAIQFPLDEPIPFKLISEIVKFRVNENLAKAEIKSNLKTCSKGHKYFKSSDYPTCPVCESFRKPKDGFFSDLSAPARRALENKGITTLKQLAQLSKEEVLQLHGLGPASIPKLEKALKKLGLTFKNKGK